MDRAHGDLGTFLGPRKPKQRWVGCLIRAVAYIHQRGIRHRDIKPENILVKQDEVFLADFGISQMGLGKTMSTTMPGLDKRRTPSYCAPEVQENRGRSRGRSADIFFPGSSSFSRCFLLIRTNKSMTNCKRYLSLLLENPLPHTSTRCMSSCASCGTYR